MREMGYIDCTPANVEEYDSYDIMGAMIMYEIQNDPEYKKACKVADERKNGKKKGQGKRTRTTPTGNTMRRVK